jgi:hypothetical protein
MSRKPGRRYFPHGDVNYVKGRGDFFTWGPWPEGYDVYIEVRDLRSERDHDYIWSDGHHKVVVTGPQPRPRSKAFIGEMAWSNAERYAGDVVSELQRSTR